MENIITEYAKQSEEKSELLNKIKPLIEGQKYGVIKNVLKTLLYQIKETVKYKIKNKEFYFIDYSKMKKECKENFFNRFRSITTQQKLSLKNHHCS